MKTNEPVRDLKEIFAYNLTALRTESKMTQLELGNAISYSDKAVSKWERGEAVPDAYVLLKLAGIFGVTVDFLLKDHERKDDIKPRRKQTNYLAVAAISVLAVFMAFAIAYISVLLASGFSYPLLFMYAALVSVIIIIVFNSLWGNPRFNVFYVSMLVVGIITTIYLILLFGGNYWQILLLNIPAVLIVICCFRVRISIKLPDFLRAADKRKKSESKEKTE